MDQFAPVLQRLRTVKRMIIGLALVCVGLGIGGCNVFDGIAPSPDSVDALVSDAETALATGNAARAVRLFERAFEKDSTDVRVRVGLGNALYADREIDVFTLRRATEHFVESGKTAETSGVGKSAREQARCTDGAQPASDGYEAVSLDAAPIQDLTEHASIIDRVHGLVVSGVLENPERGFASVEPRVRRIAFLVGSLTAVAHGVVAVDGVFGTTESTLFLDSEFASGPALVACASNSRALSQLHGALCRLRDGAQRGGLWLQARNEGEDEAQSSVLTERLQMLDDVIRARIDCS